MIQQVTVLDNTLSSLYEIDKAAAINMASDYSYGQLQRTLDMATQMRYKMLTDITKSTEEKYSDEEFERIMNL